MKTILGCLVVLTLLANASFAGVVENWTSMETGMTGSYQDSKGSKAEFAVVPGPGGSDKELKITATKVGDGYCGIYHNITADLSKSAAFKFKAKCSVAGDIQVAITDAYHVQYVSKFAVTTAWTDVTLPIASFIKDPYYTPPEAIAGHPMDLTKTGNFNLSPQMAGASVLEIGTVSADGSAAGAPAASAPAAAAPAAAAPVAAGPGLAKAVMIQDFADIPGNDGKSGGVFQDSQGSAFDFAVKDKKGGKYLVVNYSLKGDYCGMWCRAGLNDWSGVTVPPGANNLLVKVYSKVPLSVSFSLTDKNGNQYTVDSVDVKGGNWETLTIPLSSFNLDKYYTPPAAIKGAPKDFSQIKQFNIQPKTKGDKMTFAVDSLMVK